MTAHFAPCCFKPRGAAFAPAPTSPHRPPEQHPTLPSNKIDYGGRIEAFYNPLILRLFALPMPIVCAVNGVAAGAGCSLALAADFVIASQNAYFMQAFVNIGLIPDAGATWMLTRAVGRARATEMMMLGEKIDAATAKDWGLIYQVAAPEDLQENALALAARLSRGPTTSYGLVRKAIRAALDASLLETLAMERDNQRIAGATHDFKEGKSAFAEKRPPNFTGR